MKLNREETEDDPNSIYGNEPFHLKFGYSNRANCLTLLMRQEPFTSVYINF